MESAEDIQAEHGKRINYEDILAFWGKFGRVQIFYCFVLCLPTAVDGFLTMSYVFVGYNLQYRCLVPYCEQSNASYFKDNGKSLTNYVKAAIPPEALEKSCTYKEVNNPSVASCSEYMGALSSFEEEVCIITCPATQLVFDNSVVSASIVKDFLLTCDKSYLVDVIGSLFIMGGLLMSPLIGALSDAWGRGKALHLCLLGAIVSTFISIHTSNLVAFGMLRILQGGFAANLYQVAFVLAVEHVNLDYSVTIGVIMAISFSNGQVLLGLVAYATGGDWRMIQNTAAIFCICLLSMMWMVPDSPRWFLSKGKLKKAKATILKIAKLNKQEVPAQFFEHIADNTDTIINDSTDAFLASDDKSSSLIPKVEEKLTILDLFKHKNMLWRTLNLAYQWFTTSICYIGLSLISPSLHGSFYWNYTLNALVEIPGCIFYFYWIKVCGRRSVLLYCMLFSGISCMACAMSMELLAESLYQATFDVGFSLTGKLFITMCYALLYTYTSELFPTGLRNAAMGLFSCFSGMGEMGGFFHDELSKMWPPMPIILFGGLAWGSAFLLTFLPETGGCPLPETLQEALDVGKQRLKDKKTEER